MDGSTDINGNNKILREKTVINTLVEKKFGISSVSLNTDYTICVAISYSVSSISSVSLNTDYIICVAISYSVSSISLKCMIVRFLSTAVYHVKGTRKFS